MTTLGGMRMPIVPPAATDAGGEPVVVLVLAHSGSAICAMVAAVARLEPQIAAKAPQAPIVASASPPRRWPSQALQAR